MRGYQRLDSEGKVRVVDGRVRGIRNDLGRLLIWVGNALADNEIPDDQRQRLQEIRRTEQWQRDLEARRAKRHRPPPPDEVGQG